MLSGNKQAEGYPSAFPFVLDWAITARICRPALWVFLQNRYQTAGHGLRPCTPAIRARLRRGDDLPTARRTGIFLPFLVGIEASKEGLFLSYPQKKKENPGTGGLCRSLPPANAPGLNPYIVEFGHSTTHRGDSRNLGPPNPFQESLRNFFAVRIGSFFGVKGCCKWVICTFCSIFRPRTPGILPQITFFSVTVKGRKPLLYKAFIVF